MYQYFKPPTRGIINLVFLAIVLMGLGFYLYEFRQGTEAVQRDAVQATLQTAAEDHDSLMRQMTLLQAQVTALRKKNALLQARLDADARAKEAAARASRSEFRVPLPTPVVHTVDKPVSVSPRHTDTPVVADGSVWDRIAQCESGGNWHINTGNGYSGGLQFSPGTWTSHGGGQYASQAWQASREQQIVIGKRVQADQGWGAWPVCSRKAGV